MFHQNIRRIFAILAEYLTGAQATRIGIRRRFDRIDYDPIPRYRVLGFTGDQVIKDGQVSYKNIRYRVQVTEPGREGYPEFRDVSVEEWKQLVGM